MATDTRPEPEWAEDDPLLDAAEKLFYGRGYATVGMDALRDESGLSLKKIYSRFPGKDAIAVAMLDRRDRRWMSSLSTRVAREADPRARMLAIFDWLEHWLATDGHRGCAWINAHGELGATSPDIAAATRRHKANFRGFVAKQVGDALTSRPTRPGTDPAALTAGIFLLAEGAIVTAGIDGTPDAARQARGIAARLLDG